MHEKMFLDCHATCRLVHDDTGDLQLWPMKDGLLGTAMFFHCQGLVTVEALKKHDPFPEIFS